MSRIRLARKRDFRTGVAAILAVLMLLNVSACANGNSERNSPKYVISGGGTSGVYYNYGSNLASELSRNLPEDFVVAESEGSIDNLFRIGSGQALLGFAQSDAAANATLGDGTFGQRIPVRAIARLYDEYVHLVVRADSDINDVRDLRGRVVSLGARNSGVNLVSMRVMSAVGLTPGSLENKELGPDAAIEALRTGQIEAIFWVGGVPTPGLEKLSKEVQLRLVPIEAEVVEKLNANYGGVYRISEFPIGSYGWDTPTMTMSVPNYLVVSEDAPAPLVREITEQLFASRAALAQQVPTAALLDRRQAIFTDPIELHPGAAEYYTAAKH
ncbi:TAXI family TRAP transporter solute-binding subunit [Leucobacter sp. UT-8R-CII-1-4]|uniref:TAXI family TRAP transporter solute-binding subunit n=1 Tax=Leucobacter sp. UT-8R-CII-1-4 TaxID=3040075 RepID=UPI0024A80775|nr:TAXI family TRAP transporter solute-binding subunit [Leucobacter sp. UT-8R-CII-1-4]MDI6023945.1 TAXI family TRAP transporter solute-binding subunit [Leucobacter sp. UT-8R-CII-1-4]